MPSKPLRVRPRAQKAKAEAATPRAQPPNSLLLTGRRQGGHFKLFFQGKRVFVTGELLRALIRLLLSCGGGGSGERAMSRRTVYRLRKAIDQAAAPGAGA